MSAIQKFLENFIFSLLSVLRIMVFSDIFISLRKNRPRGPKRNAIVLGNGPSLDNSVDTYSKLLPEFDLMCVNFFPETGLYSRLKPLYFITGAPELWIKYVTPEWESKRIKLFETIRDTTDWPLLFMIPGLARKNKYWQKILAENPHINIVYYNITPIEGFRWFRHLCFRLGLGMPRAHNVMTPAIMQFLYFGYKKIYLLGADHSWLPEITVDDQNRVLIRQRHFYDYDTPNPAQMGNIKMGVRKLHEVLLKFYHTFGGYFIVKEYASTIGTTIINATPGSWIDAFERKDLKS